MEQLPKHQPISRRRRPSAEADAPEASPLGGLHRQFGNQAVQRATASGAALLAGGAAPAPVHRHTLPGTLAADAPARVAEAARSGGRPLPTEVAAEMSARFGVDLSAVRIHTDAAAAEAADAVHAEAYAQGSHLFFRQGAFDPSSPAGRHLLAHELTHVVQDAQGRLPRGAGDGLEVSSPSDATEREADATAAAVLASPTPEVAPSGRVAPAPAVGAASRAVMRQASGPSTVTDRRDRPQVSNVSNFELRVNGPLPVLPGVLKGEFTAKGEVDIGLNAASTTTTPQADGTSAEQRQDGSVKLTLTLTGGLVFEIAFLSIRVGIEVGAEATVRGTRSPAEALRRAYEELVRWILATRYPDAPRKIAETLAAVQGQVAKVDGAYTAILAAIPRGTRAWRAATEDQGLFDKLGLDSHADDADDATQEILSAIQELYEALDAEGEARDALRAFPSVDLVKREMQALHRLRCDTDAQKEAARAATQASRARVMAAFGRGVQQTQAGTANLGIRNDPSVELKGSAGVYVGGAVRVSEALSADATARQMATFQDGQTADGSFDTSVGSETHLAGTVAVSATLGGGLGSVRGAADVTFIWRERGGQREQELKWGVSLALRGRTSGRTLEDAAGQGVFDKPADTLKTFTEGLGGDGTLAGARRALSSLKTNLDLQALDAALMDGAAPEAATFYETRLTLGGESKWPDQRGADHVFFSFGKQLEATVDGGLVGGELKLGSALKFAFYF